MEKRIFSYKNWELVYGISPFMLEPDKKKVKEKCDGEEVDYIEERDMVVYSSPWGPRTIYGFCAKKEGEADHTVEEIKKSPTLQRQLVRLIRMDYMMVPYIFKMPAYIKSKDGLCGFAMVSVSQESDHMLCYFSLKTPVSDVSTDISEKMDNGLLDKYFSCYAVGVLETGELSGAKVYLTSVDRLALCIKDLTGKDHTKAINYDELDRFFSHYDEVSDEIEKEYIWYYSLIEDIMREIDPGFNLKFSWEDEDEDGYSEPQRREIWEYKSFSNVSPEKEVARPRGSKKDKIRELRAQGLTIGQVAKKLGLSYQVVSKEWNQ